MNQVFVKKEIARMQKFVATFKKLPDVQHWLQTILTLELCIEEFKKLLK